VRSQRVGGGRTLGERRNAAKKHALCNVPRLPKSPWLHRTGGSRTIVWPKKCRRVTEVFSGRVVAENTGRLEDTLTAPCTVLYEVEQ